MSINWQAAKALKADLAADGWLSPDTYCNFFRSPENRPAVYLFLLHKPLTDGLNGFDHALVAYVGMSARLKARWASHDILPQIQASDAWVMRWFKPTPARALRETEARYITRFDPPWNIQGRPRGVAIQ